MPSQRALARLIDAVRVGRLDPAEWVAGLAPSALDPLERTITSALRSLPVPIGPRVDGPGLYERRILLRIRALVRAQLRGDLSEVVTTARDAWLRGGGHVAYLEELAASGRLVDAAYLGRTVLHWAEAEERPAIQHFLRELSSPPKGWWQEVERFSEGPSADAWRSLMRFAPAGDRGYIRRIHTLERVLERGVEGTELLVCIAEARVTPEVLWLVDVASVEPAGVIAHLERCDGADQRAWFGVAARAAVARGDRLGVLRFLKEAGVPLSDDVDFVWTRGDDELRSMLANSGLRARIDAAGSR